MLAALLLMRACEKRLPTGRSLLAIATWPTGDAPVQSLHVQPLILALAVPSSLESRLGCKRRAASKGKGASFLTSCIHLSAPPAYAGTLMTRLAAAAPAEKCSQEGGRLVPAQFLAEFICLSQASSAASSRR